MASSLESHGLQHCPLSPGVCSDSYSLCWWCYLTISSSAAPLLLLSSIFPRIKVLSNEFVLHIRWPKYSASPSVLPMYSQDWFPLGLTGLNSQQSKGLSRVFSSISSSALSLLYSLTFISVHDYWKSMALTIQTFVSKVMSLILNALSRFVIAFLSKSKQLLISWLTSLSTVIVETKKIKSITTFTFSLSICHEMMRPNDINFFFLMLSFKPAFSLSSFTFIKRFFTSSSLSAIRMVSSAYQEKAMAPHSSTLAWKIPWTEKPGRLQSMGSQRVRHDWMTSLSLFTFMHWRRKWQHTPVFLPGESQRRRSLVGCRLWCRTELDTTQAT